MVEPQRQVADSSHAHQHGGGELHGHANRSASRRTLVIALALTLGYMVAEVIGAMVSGSLALLADAGHMITDGAALTLALLAIWVADRPASIKRTFGFQRVEVLAALLNALGLWLIVTWILIEAFRRFMDPPEVQGTLMLIVGAGGLVINIIVAWALHRSARESLNVEGAFLHVLGDLVGSIGVIVASVLIAMFGWFVVDPIFSVVIGVLILAGSMRLIWKVSHVLMEGTPSHIDLHQLCQRMEREAGVTGVHDIHAWSITTGYDAFSAHVTTDRSTGETSDQMLSRLREIAAQEFGISHITIQLEDSPDGCAEDHHIEHPPELTRTNGSQ
ncbi:MAG: cation transporter [Chloroflexi bacterium]|nr:cation transporter [Chloroflexota bacterium]